MSDRQARHLFSPGETQERAAPAEPAATSPHAVASLSRLVTANDLERIGRCVLAAGEAAYQWIIESDEIFWSANAREVLGSPVDLPASGRAFAAMLDTDNFTSRFETVMRGTAADRGEGVAFQIEYLFRPGGRNGRSAVWLEDCGRWHAGPSGKPAEVYGIIRRIDDRHRRDRHLSLLGNCDPLTGMMNRGRMAEALTEAILLAEQQGAPCAFLIAGINSLATVNDTYGFEVADEVIVGVGRRLGQVVRAGDAIARYSGSKFGMILNSCSEDDVPAAAERFLDVTRASVIETERGPVWAMLSIGVVVLPRHGRDAHAAMARAEEALAEARKLPSDGVIVYQPSPRRLSEREFNARCAGEIVACLKEDRFRLAYQPIIDARTGAIVMHEALLRMTGLNGEMITAAHLIPIAEKLGIVRLIDRAVMQMAIDVLIDHPDARLSLNVSGITATDPRWFGQLTGMLDARRDITERLTFEITETAALGDLKETASFIASLHETGCGVAIDDFGAGHTSFHVLKALEADILKIDGALCDMVASTPDHQYFVSSLIDMARKFGLRTVAEWVQRPEDAEFLRQAGIDYLQGNLFGAANMDPPWPRAPAPIAAEAPVHSAAADEAEAAAATDVDLSRLLAALSALDAGFGRKVANPVESRSMRPSFAELLGRPLASRDNG